MNIKEYLKKIIIFLSRDIWHLDLENSVSGVKKFFLQELQILILEFKIFYKNRSLASSSSLAFSTLLSLIPVLAVLFLFFKMFGDSLIQEKLKPIIYEFLTTGTGDKLSLYLDSFLESATVDAIGSVGFVFLFFAVYSILSSIEHFFNYIWGVKKDRSPVDKFKTYLSFLFISPIMVVLSSWLSSRLELVVNTKIWSGFSVAFFSIGPFLIMLLFFIFVLKAMPNCKVYTKNAIIGALYATTLYYLLKTGFVYYTKMAVSYNVIYGSIAFLPFFMLWVYSFWIVIIFSVTVSFVRQNLSNLKSLEKGIILNRFDKIRLGLAILCTIVERFIKESSPISLYQISEELNIPYNILKNLINDFEKSKILVEISEKSETYIPNLPLEQLSLRKIIYALDLMYLDLDYYQDLKIHQDPKRYKFLNSIKNYDHLLVMNNFDLNIKELLDYEK